MRSILKTFIPVTFIIISIGMINAFSFHKLPPKEFKEQLKKTHGVLIDVRTPIEYNREFISGAINMNIQSDHFSFQLDSLDKNKSYFIYYGVGKRSAKAIDIMKEKGFTNLYDLKGGLSEWKKENLPLNKSHTIYQTK